MTADIKWGHHVTASGRAGDELRLGFQLSPAEVFDFWVLGDTQRSLLGQTTRLGY